MRDKLEKLIEKGFFHIFGANVINKIIQFGSSIFLVRLVTKVDFGLYSYAQNLISIFLLFNGLGVIPGMLQFASETDNLEKKNSFFKYGFKIGFTFNILVSIFILICSVFLPLKIEESRVILAYMFLIPIIQFILGSIQIYFRALIENKKYSLLSSTNTFLLFVFSVTGAYLFSIKGIVVFSYIAYLISIIIGIKLIGGELKEIFQSSRLSKSLRISFMKFSLVSSFNNAISQLLYTIDLFLIGYIIVDQSIIASYKTATLIPFALNFIPISIMVFIYPYFARNNTNKKWIKSNYFKLTKYLIPINLFISLFLIVLAPLIIKTLFGSEYLDSVLPFRILSFGYFIAGSFRIPIGNILVMLKKIKFNMYLSIITGGLNIVLDIILIKKYGSVGAAIATVSVFIITSIAGFIYLLYILKDEKEAIK